MKEKSKLVRPWYQLMLVTISFSIIVYTLIQRINLFHTNDEYPKLVRLDPDDLKKFGYFPEKVKVGFLVTQVEEFNTIENKFIFSGILWFSFNAGNISPETIDKFEFQKGKILHQSPPTTKIIDNQIIVEYRLTIEFSTNLNYRDFPLDDHRINLRLIFPLVSTQEILLDANVQNFKILPDTKIFGWEQVNKNVESGYLVAQLDPFSPQKRIFYPSAYFSADFSRSGIRYVIIVLLPILFVFYISLFSFSLAGSTGVSMVAGGVSGMIAYRFVIENLSPQVGYFMLSDHLYFFYLGATFLVFFLAVINTYVQFSVFMKKILLTVLQIIVTGVSVYLMISI